MPRTVQEQCKNSAEDSFQQLCDGDLLDCAVSLLHSASSIVEEMSKFEGAALRSTLIEESTALREAHKTQKRHERVLATLAGGSETSSETAPVLASLLEVATSNSYKRMLAIAKKNKKAPQRLVELHARSLLHAHHKHYAAQPPPRCRRIRIHRH